MAINISTVPPINVDILPNIWLIFLPINNPVNVNINKIIINNYFKGEMKSKFILNIQGCGTTREMLEKNIEKLFATYIIIVTHLNKWLFFELNNFRIDHLLIAKYYHK